MTDPIPEGAAGVLAHLVVKGAAEALDFYQRAFGAELVCQMPSPDGRVMHSELRIGSSLIYVADDFPEFMGGQERNPAALGATTVTLHQYVEDCDAAIARAAEAGATVTLPAMDMFWGDRYGKVQDPFGHEWAFATHTKDMTPEEIAAAGEAAFSGEGCE